MPKLILIICNPPTRPQHTWRQLDQRLRAHLPADRLAGPTHCAGGTEHARRPLGSQTVLGRRAVRQDAGHPGAGPHRARGQPAHARLGHARHRLRSDHDRRGGKGRRHREDGAGADLAVGRLHYGAYAFDCGYAQ